MRVINIKSTNVNNSTIVIFARSQRFYEMPNNIRHYKKYLALLRMSEKEKVPVIITREQEDSDVILAVEKCSKKNINVKDF